ncbi:MAG: sugar ABC transporter permease [Caldilineaceae bacterium]|nr:sugar ABC transporter permease [Caldilineaceae bacterium]MCB9137075.1 sugar ABC transporter permease [Caldilineaceae bacterium]
MTVTAHPPAHSPPDKQGKRRFNEYTLTAILFLLPTVLVLLIFVIWPIFDSLRLSLYKWNGVDPTPTFIGGENWAQLARDPRMWGAIKNNFLIVLASIAIQLPVGLGLAILLDRGGRKMRIFKVAYFLPLLMSTVAIGILFKYIYDPYFGILNAFLQAIGWDSMAKAWLSDPRYALWSVILVICWQYIPFYMILFLAALTGIPSELREAGYIDGATERVYYARIALPLLRSTLVTGMTLSLIGSLKYFDLIWVMTEGGPSGATELMATYMYKKAFNSFEMGYGAAVASALFIIVSVIVLLVYFPLQNREEDLA